jgi:hypothetical protein
MIDDQFILTAERLRDDLAEFKKSLRKKYRAATRQVVAEDLKSQGARLAETWLVELVNRREIAASIGSDALADFNVRFQRLLTFSEHATKRARYDSEIAAILKRFTLDAIIPLKQSQQTGATALLSSAGIPGNFEPTAFLGHSFTADDKHVVDTVIQTLESIGISVSTGEKPKADRISEKVKRAIEANYMFVALFTRRDKIARKKKWTTSPWVIDEKAYAVGKGRKLILLREQGVESIGGIQGDYEFIEFEREQLEALIVRLLQVFELSAAGTRS